MKSTLLKALIHCKRVCCKPCFTELIIHLMAWSEKKALPYICFIIWNIFFQFWIVTRNGQNNMQGFEIVMSNTSDVGSNVCYNQTQLFSDNGRIDTSCRGLAKNVFVRKRLPPYFLSICEIEIYGKNLIHCLHGY